MGRWTQFDEVSCFNTWLCRLTEILRTITAFRRAWSGLATTQTLVDTTSGMATVGSGEVRKARSMGGSQRVCVRVTRALRTWCSQPSVVSELPSHVAGPNAVDDGDVEAAPTHSNGYHLLNPDVNVVSSLWHSGQGTDRFISSRAMPMWTQPLIGHSSLSSLLSQWCSSSSGAWFSPLDSLLVRLAAATLKPTLSNQATLVGTLPMRTIFPSTDYKL